MPEPGYVFERLAMVSYIVPCFYMALFNPGYYNHLTYWTLLVHCVYYTVDKVRSAVHACVRALTMSSPPVYRPRSCLRASRRPTRRTSPLSSTACPSVARGRSWLATR